MLFLKNLVRILKYTFNHPLNRTHRYGAVINFFRWQLGFRLLRKRVIVPWVEDSRLVVGKGETGVTWNLYSGLAEFADMLFLLHALQPGHTFVDVGANAGAYTILASKVVGAKTIAFEPIPETAERLRDQVQINRIERLAQIRIMGVANKKGTLLFTNKNDTMNRVNSAISTKDTTAVTVTTLDAEVPEGDTVFLKIDAEGFDFNVLEGAQRVLSSEKFVALIIELNGSGEEFGHSNLDIHHKVSSFGLIAVEYDPISRSLNEIDSYESNENPIFGGNTIYVRDIQLVRDLISRAPKRIVHTANGIRI